MSLLITKGLGASGGTRVVRFEPQKVKVRIKRGPKRVKVTMKVQLKVKLKR